MTKDELLALAAYLDEDAELLDKHGAIGDGNNSREAAALIRSMAEAGVEKCLELADDYSDVCYVEGRDGRPAVESNEARAALETALRSLAVQPDEWRPIETAPKDEHILLWGLGGPFISKWADYYRHNQPKITHWQPLPKPPAAPSINAQES